MPLTDKEDREVDECFEMFDEEAEGILEMSNLMKMMGLLGWNPTMQDLETLVKECRMTQIKKMTKQQFKDLMVHWYKNHTKDNEQQLKEAFSVFDTDGSGYIEWDELKYVMQGAGEPLTDDEVVLMMKEADKDGDGRIDYKEFVCMMQGDQELLS